MNVYLEKYVYYVSIKLYQIFNMAQLFLTKSLFKCLGRHLGKEALAGTKEAWTPDIMARAVSIIENRYKMISTINRNLTRFKAFIDSLEPDQPDGALEPDVDISDSPESESEGGTEPESEGGPEHEGAPEPKIDQTLLLNALAKYRQAIDDKKLATKIIKAV